MPNYSIFSIPLFWLISLYPHAYAISLIKSSNNNKWDNLNPRGIATNASYQKHVPAECYALFEKAEAAHKNGLESAPFFVGAVVLGNVVGLGALTMNIFSGSYLALRTLYTVLYLRCTTQETSRLRSLTWMASVGCVVGVYVAAGSKWAGKH
ncbi:hypothetical protein CC86DRAFT_372332 [Ophiobolus disseminans]|uniref:Membrane-associated proteins in eicosanoid and glutathione metabolism n=1 Tax=Ophiobolus disseminans TaxID=1469910 RepID=A0A6A6ZRC4_9PLEO|nr:hypothetical protein CC86DRAFT_372332 [Ophiobolus disseminans]